MRTQRSITEPVRTDASWEEKWEGPDNGLIACWERGREKSGESPELAKQALSGQLVVLPWKGGVEKVLKKKKKYGTLFYLAMWRGLRGEDLDLDWDEEPMLVCTVTNMEVTFTGDYAKYANA